MSFTRAAIAITAPVLLAAFIALPRAVTAAVRPPGFYGDLAVVDGQTDLYFGHAMAANERFLAVGSPSNFVGVGTSRVRSDSSSMYSCGSYAFLPRSCCF